MSNKEVEKKEYNLKKKYKTIKGKVLDIYNDKIVINRQTYSADDIQYILVRAQVSRIKYLRNTDLISYTVKPPLKHLHGYIEIGLIDRKYRFIRVKDTMEKYTKLIKLTDDIEAYYVSDVDRVLYVYTEDEK